MNYGTLADFEKGAPDFFSLDLDLLIPQELPILSEDSSIDPTEDGQSFLNGPTLFDIFPSMAACDPSEVYSSPELASEKTDPTDSVKPPIPIERGVSSGGSATRPPPLEPNSDYEYRKVGLQVVNAAVSEICLPHWNHYESSDKRRIVRITRVQDGCHVKAVFSILGSAKEHPIPDAQDNFVEVSCLECETDQEFYITSVEVVKIVELLIGCEGTNSESRRRERGRIRSNLVPFWSRKPISSKKMGEVNSPDSRAQLAQRIMAYQIRKPRGFDKEVRIMKWSKLAPALARAMKSYYVRIPKPI